MVEKNEIEFQERVNETEEFLNEKLRSIEKIDDKYFKLLCLFSLLDMLSQEYSNYTLNHEQEKFTKYILQFQDKWDFLSEVDPVTLYYDVREHLDETINLDYLVECNIYEPSQLVNNGRVEEIVKALKSKEVPRINTILFRHRYVNLLFRLRCKVSHELASPGSILDINNPYIKQLPHFISITRYYKVFKESISDEVWELMIPVEFIEQLVTNCMSNYFKYCVQSHKYPFENNRFERRYHVTWYDWSF